MTHRKRILADRLIAVPVAFLFNGVARVLGKVMQRDHSVTSSNVRRIVVAKLLGMGSILQATPLLKALKGRYPDAKITFVTLASNRDLVERLSCVDEILLLDDRNLAWMAFTTLRTIVALVRSRADLYFDLEVYSAFASLLALWAVTRNRIGFYRHSAAFKKGIYTQLVYFNTRMAVRHLYLQLGRVAGVPPGESDVIGPIRLDEEARAGIRRFLAKVPEWQPGVPYVVVNPNASDLLLERRWPAKYYGEAIQSLASQGFQIALIGTRDEREYVESLIDTLPAEAESRVANTAGRLNLGELFVLLESAECVVTNDTGPMHMAIALQRPTVCLFGPASPEHYGLDLPYVEILYEPVFCSPCLHEADEPPCNGNNVCMQQIRPQAVVDAVRRLTGAGMRDPTARASWRLNCLPVIAEACDGKPLGVVERVSLARDEEPDESDFHDRDGCGPSERIGIPVGK